MDLRRKYNNVSNITLGIITRSNDMDFTLEKPRTNTMKKGISYSAASLWNELPRSSKQKKSSFN
jgi:hypothetical protein